MASKKRFPKTVWAGYSDGVLLVDATAEGLVDELEEEVGDVVAVAEYRLVRTAKGSRCLRLDLAR